MLLLISSLLALWLGPILYRLARNRSTPLAVIDGFVLVTISGLILLYVIPESMEAGGWWALLFAVAGLLGPTLGEMSFHRAARQTHLVALFLGLTGLMIHSVLDGAALASPQDVQSRSALLLPLAVVLHQLPVGLAIWWLLRPAFGRHLALGVMTMACLATVGGFWAAPFLTLHFSPLGLAWFQALVAGSLLHVVFHSGGAHRHDACCEHETTSPRWAEGSGALLGILLVFILVGRSAGLESFSGQLGAARTFWVLALESAPALVLAYVMAGLLTVFLPASSILWMSRGGRLSQSLRGMALGLPFPVCSCGVVPLYRTLMQQGAPATAGMAFLIATPELGLDAVLLSFPLLGVELSILRIAAAVFVALGVGWLVGSWTPALKRVTASDEPGGPATSRTIWWPRRLHAALKTGLGEVVDHTAPWILFGLLVAALAEPFLDSRWLEAIPPLLEIPLFALLGLPAYICASGATPLVAVLLYKGISPGAALVFLITGPATNVTTFGLIARLHGRRTALAFSTAVLGLTILFGYAVNAFLPPLRGIELQEAAAHAPSPVELVSLFLLALIFLASLLRRGPRRFLSELTFQE